MTSVESSSPRCFRSVSRRGDRLIGLAGEAAVVLDDIAVAVPAPLVLHAAAVDLHEAHAALDQPPRHQALLGEMRSTWDCRGRTAPCDRGRLAVDVEGLGRGHLHAVGQLEALDPRGQFGLGRVLLQVPAIEPSEQVELRPLLGRRSSLRGCGRGCRSGALGR